MTNTRSRRRESPQGKARSSGRSKRTKDWGDEATQPADIAGPGRPDDREEEEVPEEEEPALHLYSRATSLDFLFQAFPRYLQLWTDVVVNSTKASGSSFSLASFSTPISKRLETSSWNAFSSSDASSCGDTTGSCSMSPLSQENCTSSSLFSPNSLLYSSFHLVHQIGIHLQVHIPWLHTCLLPVQLCPLVLRMQVGTDAMDL